MEQKANRYTVTIGGVDYTPHAVFPVTFERLLDEQLDSGCIVIKQVKEDLFEPFTEVVIKMNDDEPIVMDVMNDISEELPVGSGRYNHNVGLIEQTKRLERFICRSLTFQNALGRTYTVGVAVLTPNIIVDKGYNKDYIVTPDYYKIIVNEGNFTFLPFNEVCPIDFVPSVDNQSYYMQVFRGDERIAFKSYEHVSINSPQERVTLDLTSTPYKYTVYYGMNNDGIVPDEYADPQLIFSYSFLVVKDLASLPPYTVKDVIDRVLLLGTTTNRGETPLYELDPEQADWLAGIKAPEFSFTQNTLREQLNQIGGFIHAMPRLVGNKIHYDRYGSGTYSTIKNKSYGRKTLTRDIENDFISLDSTVDNLVCVTDYAQGTARDPGGDNGFTTPRTESVYVRLSADNIMIPTQYPIYQVTRLVWKSPENKEYILTPYVFEDAEYLQLSSYAGSYPTAKAWALHFKQGEKNIDELGFKNPNAVTDAFKEFAIENIIRAAMGDTSFNVKDDNITELLFKVEYIPIFSARVQHSKPYIGDMVFPSVRIYNQANNIVETRYYGENLKGTAARYGNTDMTYSYILHNMSDIPRVGELYDDEYYIARVTSEIMPFFVKCEVGLSKDFNRLSQYIGISSARRYYEVSEKQAYRSDLKYTDYIVVGDQLDVVKSTLIKNEGWNAIASTFVSLGLGSKSVSLVKAISYNEVDSALKPQAEVGLPVVSVALGNTMLFHFEYEDNFSAGMNAASQVVDEVKGTFTQAVPYADYYGRFDYLELQFSTVAPSAPTNDEAVKQGMALPTIGALPNPYDLLATGVGDEMWRVDKNGGEALSCNYVIEFVTNRKDIVIGSALSRDCPLVRGDSVAISALYILPRKLNRFDDTVDLTGATKVVTYSVLSNKIKVMKNRHIQIEDEIAPVSGEAWAIVRNGELLIGSNKAVTEGESMNLPCLTGTHQIFNF